MSGVEFDGQRCRAADSRDGLPRDGSAAARVRHQPGHDYQRFGEFDSGQMRTQAVVPSTAEGQHRRRTLPGDVETIGFVVDRGVAIGCRGAGDNARARRDADIVEFDVVDGNPHTAESDWEVTDQLLHRARCQLGMLDQQRPLAGMVGENLHRGGQLITGGVGSGVEQDGDEVDELVASKALAVVFGSDELGSQIITEVLAATIDRVSDIGVELLPRGHDVAAARETAETAWRHMRIQPQVAAVQRPFNAEVELGSGRFRCGSPVGRRGGRNDNGLALGVGTAGTRTGRDRPR
ncbi:hypothetical protein A4G27_09550 [Mycobacterium kansasii]|nr:hypothetical protein A4G27_09550 [Mycobacterium kansasii]